MLLTGKSMLHHCKLIRTCVLFFIVFCHFWLCNLAASNNPSLAIDEADKKLPTFREYREKVIALAQSAKGAAAAAKLAAANSAAASSSSSGKAASSASNNHAASSSSSAANADASSAAESGSGASHDTDPPAGHAIMPSPPLKKNVASVECGAKALGWNKEAKDVDAILTDNRDLYMKNLCTANKWLDLQLCEPVSLRRLELANFELFSSAFKNMSVLASDVYPPRDWIQVANLTLNASRTWQIFDLHTDKFVQYIRLLFSEHWGSEHYCTLTHVRLLGVLAADIVDSDPDGDDLWSDEHQRILSLASTIDTPGGEFGGVQLADAARGGASTDQADDCIGVANSTTRLTAQQANWGTCPANCTFRRLLVSNWSRSSTSSTAAPQAAAESTGRFEPESAAERDSEPSTSSLKADEFSSSAAASSTNPMGSKLTESEPTNSSLGPSKTLTVKDTDAASKLSQSEDESSSSIASSSSSARSPSSESNVDSSPPSPPPPPPPPPPSNHQPTLNGLGGGGSGFAILASRLKELERNVSLSMRYLEELSLAFNRHVQRLSINNRRNASYKSALRRRLDLAQSARISALERRLESAPFVLGVLHCLFLALHAALLAVCWCRRRR